MPSRIRRNLVDPTKVGIYLCESRCVRRAFHGQDLSGLDVSHRRRWVIERMKDLASVFAIDVLDYGVQDNSLHSLLKIRPDVVARWGDEEVVRRWYRLNRQQLALNDTPLSQEVLDAYLSDGDWIIELRSRLCSLSWFMIMLKEPLSRRANEEDQLSGHFFAERFGCERCETLEDIVQASVFTSLSPVHAGVAESPETSGFTALGDRLDRRAVESACESSGGSARRIATEIVSALPDVDWLAPLFLEGDEAGKDVEADEEIGNGRSTKEGLLPFGIDEYRALMAICRQKLFAGSNEETQVEHTREVYEGLVGGEGCENAAATGSATASNWNSSDSAADLQQDGMVSSDARRLALIPEEMPEMLERYGLDRVRWAEAYRHNWRRFARITRKTDALRHDFQQIARRCR